MGPDVLYLTGSVALLCIGGGTAWVAFQVGQLIQQARETLLPELTRTVQAAQENLGQLEQLTRDADVTVQGANEIVAAAQRGVSTVERAAEHVGHAVSHQARIRAQAAAAGMSAAWRSYRARRQARQEATAPPQAEPAAP